MGKYELTKYISHMGYGECFNETYEAESLEDAMKQFGNPAGSQTDTIWGIQWDIRVLKSNGSEKENALEAINNSRELMPGYFNATLAQRLPEGSGSCYVDRGIENPYDLQMMLLRANWKEVYHPEVMKGCTCYMTRDIPGGRLGIVPVASMPDDTKFLAIDPKHTGNVSIAAGVTKRDKAKYPTRETYMIVGKDPDQEKPEDREKSVVYTFHPGEPVRPSIVSTKDIPDGTVLTKQEVLDLGFEMAKLDTDARKIIKEKEKEEAKEEEDIGTFMVNGEEKGLTHSELESAILSGGNNIQVVQESNIGSIDISDGLDERE